MNGLGEGQAGAGWPQAPGWVGGCACSSSHCPTKVPVSVTEGTGWKSVLRYLGRYLVLSRGKRSASGRTGQERRA